MYSNCWWDKTLSLKTIRRARLLRERAVLKVGQKESIRKLGSGTNKVKKSNHDIQLIVNFFTHLRYMFIEL